MVSVYDIGTQLLPTNSTLALIIKKSKLFFPFHDIFGKDVQKETIHTMIIRRRMKWETN